MGAALDYLRLPLESLSDPLPAPMVGRTFDAVITPPGSKSLANRCLLLAALARGVSTLDDVPTDSEDVSVMIESLGRLGVRCDVVGRRVRVEGAAGCWPGRGETRLDVRNAGTAARFLAGAALLAAPGAAIVIDGSGRMRQRPIGELAELLTQLGARCSYEGVEGFPPVSIVPPVGPIAEGAAVVVGRTASSQFISAVMLAGVFLPAGLSLNFADPITSRSYVEMTRRLIVELGGAAEWTAADRIRIGGGGLDAFGTGIEPDASGATALWAAGAVVPGASVTVPGLNARSSQADAGLVNVLGRMGAAMIDNGVSLTVRGGGHLTGINADLRDMPDASLALAAACALAESPSELTGLATLRVKETDRIAALQRELGKIGARVTVIHAGSDSEGIRIEPAPRAALQDPAAPDVAFETYDDHRMAMAMAVIGLLRPNCWIRDPGCVRKTYPGFWRDWAAMLES